MPEVERLYLQQPRLFQFRATVTDIREYARKDGVQIWQIALNRTAFYPTGGGQPHDLGVLTAKARSGAELTVQVDDVVEDEAGEVWHATAKPLLTGTEVRGTVDADRRVDHMQQHSGQHLLSAVLASDLGLRTIAFHMGEDDATIDLAPDSGEVEEASIARLAEAELRVNQLIASNAAVTVRTVSNSGAQTLLASGALRKLPPRTGDIRLVEIAGLDLNACGGTHVDALGEIGCLLLREVERVKKTLRLHFLCGPRAIRAARADFITLGAAAGVLSVGSRGLPAAVERLQAEARALAKERQRLREEMAARHAVQLAVEERIVGGLRLVCRSFADRDPDYLKLLAWRLLEAVPHTVALLTSTAQEPATVVIASNRVLESGSPASCAAMLRRVLAPYHLRGGGTAQLAQAQVPSDLLGTISEELQRELVCC